MKIEHVKLDKNIIYILGIKIKLPLERNNALQQRR